MSPDSPSPTAMSGPMPPMARLARGVAARLGELGRRLLLRNGPRPRERGRPRLLFVVTETGYFASHRLHLATAALDAGYDVHLAARAGARTAEIREAEITVHELPWSRSDGMLATLRSVAALSALCRSLAPDVVHAVSLKPILVSSLAGLLTSSPLRVNAVTGLGYSFASDAARARVARALIAVLLRVAADRRGSVYLFQNADDEATLRRLGAIRRAGTALIPGAGVDTSRHRALPEPDASPVTLAVVCRMLAIKGVREVVAASRLLSERGVAHRLLLVGARDPANPSSLGEDELRSWADGERVAWLGHVDDVASVWARSHIAVLASHGGEGLPKSLLEAGACGRPIVATDVAGNRDLVADGSAGLLVPARDPQALAAACAQLIRDRSLRLDLGAGARRLVADRFEAQAVAQATVSLYAQAGVPAPPRPQADARPAAAGARAEIAPAPLVA